MKKNLTVCLLLDNLRSNSKTYNLSSRFYTVCFLLFCGMQLVTLFKLSFVNVPCFGLMAFTCRQYTLESRNDIENMSRITNMLVWTWTAGHFESPFATCDCRSCHCRQAAWLQWSYSNPVTTGLLMSCGCKELISTFKQAMVFLRFFLKSYL